MLAFGEVLYDPRHHPAIPEGWIFRALLGLAALMRSFGAVLAIHTSAILLSLPLLPYAHKIPMPRRLGENMLLAIPESIMALIVSWMLVRFAHRTTLSELGLGWDRSAIRELLFATIAGALAIALVIAPPLLSGAGQWLPAEAKVRGPSGALILLGLLALAAFSEELILRGYPLQTLAHPLHLLGGLILTSGGFAALHWNNFGANEFTTTNTFLAGCVLGMIVAWRRSLWAATGAHFGWNLATILAGLNVSGIPIPVMPYKLSWSASPL